MKLREGPHHERASSSGKERQTVANVVAAKTQTETLKKIESNVRLGQTEKNSAGANVFRVTLKSGHRSAVGMSQKCATADFHGPSKT
jgi:hypothetical protein